MFVADRALHRVFAVQGLKNRLHAKEGEPTEADQLFEDKVKQSMMVYHT